MLSHWLQDLRETKTIDEVVSFAASHLERVRAAGRAPPSVADHPVDVREDVRDIAAALARQPFVYNAPGYEDGPGPQLLILFSLASDRLAQIEGRGAARRPSVPVICAP